MNKIKFLYHSDYWDGPLSGVCKVDEQKLWFKCVHDYHDETKSGHRLSQRIYAVYNLTKKEWSAENKWHALFEEYVGNHTSYDEKGLRTGSVRKDTDHGVFYRQQEKAMKEGTYKTKELNLDKLIGYFDHFEMKLRPTKHRDYWLEGEAPHSIHHKKCEEWECIEYKDPVSYFDWDLGKQGTKPGWALCIADDEGYEAKWSLVKFCPWCGVELSEKPPIE